MGRYFDIRPVCPDRLDPQTRGWHEATGCFRDFRRVSMAALRRRLPDYFAYEQRRQRALRSASTFDRRCQFWVTSVVSDVSSGCPLLLSSLNRQITRIGAPSTILSTLVAVCLKLGAPPNSTIYILDSEKLFLCFCSFPFYLVKCFPFGVPVIVNKPKVSN